MSRGHNVVEAVKTDKSLRYSAGKVSGTLHVAGNDLRVAKVR